MKDDPLIGPKLKIERANRHIGDVHAHILTFFQPPPHYTSYRDGDVERGQESLKIKLIRTVPKEISVAVGDAVSNLRSALDQLVSALAIKNGAHDLARVEFPIADSLEIFERPTTRKKIEKISSEAAAMIHDLKPYRGGNDLLWAMNTLRNTDIHRHLVLLAMSLYGHQANMTMQMREGLNFIEQPTWRPFTPDEDITIATYSAPLEMKYELQVQLMIAVRNVEVIEGQPILAVLHQLSDMVARILYAFEMRFFA
jgi:hypothetical protein